MAADYTRTYYPVFLDLSGRRCVVVGAGDVGERKIETLLEYGGAVDVISPAATDAVAAWAEEGRLTWQKRGYEEGDLEGAFLAICATDDPDLNRAVFAEGERRSIITNIVDVPDLCNFIVPSIVRRGPLQIAISTAGAAPVVAKQLRRELEATYGDEWGDYVALLGRVRTLVMDRVPGGEPVRKPIFTAIASAGLFDRISAGERLEAEDIYTEIVAPMLESGRSDG